MQETENTQKHTRLEHIEQKHQRAMDLASQALVGGHDGIASSDRPNGLLHQAFELEKECAETLMEEHDMEPSRSILLRSAASLALQCSFYHDAIRLVEAALEGHPPAMIKNELLAISRQINESVFSRG